MGLYEQALEHKPVVNEEFTNTKKQLSGDAVCTIEVKDITAKKDGKRYIIIEGTAINVVETKSKKTVTLDVGDEISKIYDIESEDESKADKVFGGAPNLLNDLFTAGIQFEKGSCQNEMIENIIKSADGQKVYFSTWMGKKWTTHDDGASFEEVEGEKVQKIKILSSNKITPENSQAVLPI